MSSQTTFERVVAAAFALSAVVVAAVVVTVAVRREFLPPAQDPSEAITEPVPVENWEELIATGHSVGPRDAGATILVFEDFECPACRQFALGPLRELRSRYGDDVRVVHRHWPLPYHRFAYPAARASECAAAQGRFEAYRDLLFEKQDSLGLKTFTAFAVESGVPDIPAFDECNSETQPLPAITADSAAARGVGGTGTPTVLINGLRLPRTRLLVPLVEAALDGSLVGSPVEGGAMALPITHWDTVPELRLVRELRIEGASAGLTRIGTLAVAADGSMAVSQPETSSVVVFDAQGVRLGRFGRRAGGVGEIASVARAGWKGDTVWVHDLVQDRVVYGTLPARVVRTAPLLRDAVPEPSRADSLPAAFSGILPLAIYGDGSMYASSVVSGEQAEPPVSATVRRYVRINPTGEVSRIVAEVPEALFVRLETGVGRYGSRGPFVRGGLHDLSLQGDYVATVKKHIEGEHGGRFDVVLQESMGDTIYARTYPFVGVPIPPALADSVIEARAARIQSRTMARLFREEAPIPPVYPPVSSVVAGTDGTVWVGLAATEEDANHLVLDPRGIPLGAVSLLRSMRVVAADRTTAWVVERDAFGVDSVVRYRVILHVRAEAVAEPGAAVAHRRPLQTSARRE
jgi:protein-disulfide isomerase